MENKKESRKECAEEDSNLHRISPTTTSKLRVYHSTICAMKSKSVATRLMERIISGNTFIALGLIRFYKKFIDPHKPKSCRFYPSCSDYMSEAIQKKGLMKGLWKGCIRLLKCHPFHPGGLDFVEDCGISNSLPTDKT
jgi:putative membrane protein insertion efficiency factor